MWNSNNSGEKSVIIELMSWKKEVEEAFGGRRIDQQEKRVTTQQSSGKIDSIALFSRERKERNLIAYRL